MAIFSIKPLIHLSRQVVKKWDAMVLLQCSSMLSLGVLLLFFMMAVFLGTVSNAPTLSANSRMSIPEMKVFINTCFCVPYALYHLIYHPVSFKNTLIFLLQFYSL